MRRFATPLLVVLALLGVAHPAPALRAGSLVAVPLHELKPTQMQVGRAEVDAKLGGWEKKARAQGMSLAKFAKTKLVPKFAKAGIEAVIDPRGHIRPTDGHHRISSLLELERRTGVQVPVQVKISADYRGKSMEIYAHDFLETRGKGYFTPNVMHLPAVDRVMRLPDSFGELENSPMRSAMAQLFARMKLDDGKMVDYAEFKLADYLVDHRVFADLEAAGLIERGTSHLPQSLAKDPRALSVMQNALATPDAKKFIGGLTRTSAQ